ncbi:hypothetical protein NDU88_003788, partial [Pleurodeles waltl]
PKRALFYLGKINSPGFLKISLLPSSKCWQIWYTGSPRQEEWGRGMDLVNRRHEGDGQVHQTDLKKQAAHRAQSKRDSSVAQRTMKSNRKGTGLCTWTTESRGERGKGSKLTIPDRQEGQLQ